MLGFEYKDNPPKTIKIMADGNISIGKPTHFEVNNGKF